MSFVKITEDKRVTTITIDRPQALNALNAEVLSQIHAAVLKVNSPVVIFTGAGPKAFVAGADIAAMAEMNALEARAFVEFGQGVIRAIEEAPFISIAAVNGFALGGGCELAMACDLIYASENAKLGLPETNLGIIPGFGGTVNLTARVGFHRALEMALTGKMVSAAEAKAFGLVLEVYKPDELMPKVNELAEMLSKKGRLSLLAARRLIRGVTFETKDRALLLERESFATLFAGNEPKEGLRAFLEKREPKFNG